MAYARSTITFPQDDILIDPEFLAERFLEEAGKLGKNVLQGLLGTDEILRLSPEYAAKKPTLPGYVRYPNKSADQPLILTGDIYTGVNAEVEGQTVSIGVEDGHGMAPDGFDYWELWQERIGLLEMVRDIVEPQLELLGDRLIVGERIVR